MAQLKISDHWGNLITYQTLFGVWPTLAELEQRLRPLRRNDVVLRLAWCDAFTLTSAMVRGNETDKRARNYLFLSGTRDLNSGQNS
jgi:hypothetical protein